MKDYELKPCPFCGGEAEMAQLEIQGQFMNRKIKRPVCTKCGATMFCWISTRRSVEAWNRRTDNG